MSNTHKIIIHPRQYSIYTNHASKAEMINPKPKTNLNISSAYCTIYLVRHGETDLNAQNRVQGRIDRPLSEKGISQAEKLSQSLANTNFSAIYSSTLTRAHQTAEIIAREFHLPVVASDQIQERNYGEMDNIKLSDLPESVKDLMKKRQSFDYPTRAKLQLVPHYEPDNDVFARSATYLLNLAKTHQDQSILVVSHDAVMRTLLIHLGYATYQDSLRIENTGYIIIHSDGKKLKVINTSGIEFAKTN